ncbi:HNH endonuclease [Pantoea ananatis]|uniref:HNH endonuclease n=1 Tax=Pantoea ananas TaxID=553 RepID=UPI002221532E|nr:HNH endonuclease [Pantoea ananatis]MCW1831970.1 HNH endonuclease [Pantoea ananatis]
MSNINFNDYFIYDETSPSLLVNKTDRYLNPKGSPVKVQLHKGKYYTLSLKGKHQAHRVIWELINGLIPEGLTIDHINRDGTDNRIINLRLATSRENMLNRIQPRSSAELPPGIRFHRGTYEARIRTEGDRLGKTSKRLEVVKAWLLEMRIKLNGEFAILDGLQTT